LFTGWVLVVGVAGCAEEFEVGDFGSAAGGVLGRRVVGGVFVLAAGADRGGERAVVSAAGDEVEGAA
jgi:hypothetical protein